MKRIMQYMINKSILCLLVVFVFVGNTSAQQIMIDRGVKAGDLWCFPLLTDSLVYLYLPSDARLGTDDKGQPQFSFLRYVDNTKDSTAGNNSITKTGGGARLNFL